MKKVDVEKILFFNLLLISMFPLLPKAAESILMMLFFLLSLIVIIKKRETIKKPKIKSLFIISSVFVIYLMSSFYSENNKENVNFLIRVIPILMFPLSIGLLPASIVTSNRLRTIKIVYISSVFISLLFAHIQLKSNFYISQWEYRNSFEDLKKVHGTYFSLWIGFSVLIIINDYVISYYKGKNSLKVLLALLMTSYLIYWQITINARLPLFVTLLLLTIISFKTLEIKKQIYIYSFIIITVLLTFYLNFELIKEKVKFNLPEGKYELNHKTMSSEEIRAGIYYCSTSLIKKSWIYGYGIGDVNDQLNLCYKSKINSDVYQIFHYNSHNQYIQIFLAGGIIGLLYFLFNIYYVLKKSIVRKDNVFIMFNVLLIICFLTENILSRHDGILFYSFFSSIFFYYKKT